VDVAPTSNARTIRGELADLASQEDRLVTIALRVCLFLSIVSALACQAPAMGPPVTLGPVGLSGGALAGSVEVVVLDEATGVELAGATVVCGDATLTTSAGSAVRCQEAGASASLVVSAPGHVTERWLGITQSRAVVALAPRASTRTLEGEITGATERVSVGVSSEFGILRSSDVTRGAADCADAAACTVSAEASSASAHDVAVLDHGGGRLVLVRDVAIDAEGRFAVDVLAAEESEPLIDLSVTLPGAVGLTEVVGVPGLSTENGVALLGSLAEGTSVLAPAREASLAGDRLWFVAHARTEDGAGESFALDRDVAVGQTAVELPSAFLAVPIASVAEGVVTITTDAMASLYVVESSDAGGVVERAVVFAPGASIEVPVASASVRVRAIDAGGVVELGAVAASTTRFADRVL
jgi:hypothetical protein